VISPVKDADAKESNGEVNGEQEGEPVEEVPKPPRTVTNLLLNLYYKNN
jgi:hypothetical protein